MHALRFILYPDYLHGRERETGSRRRSARHEAGEPGRLIADDRVFSELADLAADYDRYVPWLPYPRVGVAELESPTAETTSWHFSLIDPMTIDFLNATKSH